MGMQSIYYRNEIRVGSGSALTAMQAGGPPSYQRLETVLLIEDNVELSNSLNLRLSARNYNVVNALDGITGLEQVELFDPELILLDLGLPRLNGMKLLHELRHMEGMGDVPIVVVTGNLDPKVEEKARGFGIERFLRKPIRQRKIVDIVDRILRGEA